MLSAWPAPPCGSLPAPMSLVSQPAHHLLQEDLLVPRWDHVPLLCPSCTSAYYFPPCWTRCSSEAVWPYSQHTVGPQCGFPGPGNSEIQLPAPVLLLTSKLDESLTLCEGEGVGTGHDPPVPQMFWGAACPGLGFLDPLVGRGKKRGRVTCWGVWNSCVFLCHPMSSPETPIGTALCSPLLEVVRAVGNRDQ